MEFREYGTKNKETIILLHGGGLSWWNYRDEAKLLENRYHVILPILDGHGGSDRHFISIEDNAQKIIDFIDSRSGGSVLLIGGLSLGGQILLEILSQRKDICRYAIVESASVIPSTMARGLIGPSIAMAYKMIENPAFSKAQFKNLKIRQDLYSDYYSDTCRIDKADLISFMRASLSYSLKDSIKNTQAEVHIYAGEKDNLNIIRSAKIINETIPASTLTYLPDLYHGQFSLNHSEEYVSDILKIVE